MESQQLGELSSTGETGVYGMIENPSLIQGTALPVAFKQEVKAGKLQIITTLDGQSAEKFEVMIEEVNYDDNNPTKIWWSKSPIPASVKSGNWWLQGMSGSPLSRMASLSALSPTFLSMIRQKGYGIFLPKICCPALKMLNFLQQMPRKN